MSGPQHKRFIMNFIAAVIAVFVLSGMIASRPHVRAQELPPVVPEAKPVPRGIKGAKFGMKPKALKRKLPYLVDAHETDTQAVRYESQTVEFPGTQLEAETTIGPAVAHCIFLFVRAIGLVRIECNIDIDNKYTFDQTRKAIIKVLRSKYGNPLSKSKPFFCEDHGSHGDSEGFMPSFKNIKCMGLWRWDDDDAMLAVSAKSQEYTSSFLAGISIINESPQYKRALDRAVRRAKRLYKQEMYELWRKEQKLEHNRRRYDQDL